MCIRFGHDHDPDCMAMDETLYNVSEKVQNFAIIYLGKLPLPFSPSTRFRYPSSAGELLMRFSRYHRSPRFQQGAPKEPLLSLCREEAVC